LIVAINHPDRITLEEQQGAIIVEHLPWVKSVAGRLRKTKPIVARLPFDEVLAAGCDGLRKALKTYKPELGHKLTTYSYLPVRQAILEEAGRQFLIRIPKRSLGDEYPVIENLIGDCPFDWCPESDTDQTDALDRAFATVGEPYVQVLKLHYGLGCDPLALDLVARVVGVTGERVRVLLAEGLELMRSALDDSLLMKVLREVAEEA
jgi:RNA polymerase sigma factor (sigma-70 family)